MEELFTREEIMTALQSLAEPLSTTVEQLWTILVVQLQIDAVFVLIAPLLLLPLLLLITRYSYRIEKGHREKNRLNTCFEQDLAKAVMVISAFFSFLTTLYWISHLHFAITVFFNPNYAVLEKITSLLTSGQ